MDLAGAAWMVREIGQPISAIYLCEDGRIIAGGWDGNLSVWDSDGNNLLSIECGDRIETIATLENRIIVTSGLNLVCILDKTIDWKFPLEGSADLLIIVDKQIVATSSVYDIEHGDFMEGAIWKFSSNGELISVNRIDERPWFVAHETNLIVGLGRPRCGILIDEKHSLLPTESPVTCGYSKDKDIFFGHADGSLSDINGNIICTEDHSIESIDYMEQRLVLALDDNKIISKTLDDKLMWFSEGPQITCHVLGFDLMHWCGRYNGAIGLVEVRSENGDLIATLEDSKPKTATADEKRVAIGFENGQIMVWSKELFSRRKDLKLESEIPRNLELAAKLRSLRK
ncbi:MAG: hypothetical protein QGI21_05290 [Candidatus Poseidoniaceae archaeon]|jgi:hypothetical protein|nr:hypothetical protein [Candidatus Poseidoniaceae archaeon]